MNGRTITISKLQALASLGQKFVGTTAGLLSVLLLNLEASTLAAERIASQPPQSSSPQRDSQFTPAAVPSAPAPSGNRITAATVSQTGLTIPSLWWIQEQFGDKLLEDWAADVVADDQPGQVDLIVNRQLWTLLDYLDRYAFITKFGTVARDFGYNLQVLYRTDSQSVKLAAYTCNFSSVNIRALRQAQQLPDSSESNNSTNSANTQSTDTIPCSISLDSAGKAGFRGGRTSPFGGAK